MPFLSPNVQHRATERNLIGKELITKFSGFNEKGYLNKIFMC